MPADDLAAVAGDVFGAGPGRGERRLDDAIERGGRARRGRHAGSAAPGVVVTGSIVTVGEARHLLGGRGPG